ncbi:hypothetical protein Thermo_01726 [Thermoplasmatales archaeon]|nr:hypothetical protein Thermo_01726 [Thermoplasmatales archaeon]
MLNMIWRKRIHWNRYTGYLALPTDWVRINSDTPPMAVILTELSDGSLRLELEKEAENV